MTMTRWWFERIITLKNYYSINTFQLIDEEKDVKEWESEKGSEIKKQRLMKGIGDKWWDILA